MAVQKGHSIELLIVGGAAMILLYDARLSTRDVDAFILSPEGRIVRGMVEQIAEERIAKTMNKQEFAQLFANALETAVQNGEKKLRCPLPRDYQILLYGTGCSGVLLDPACVLERLYLGEDKFYRIIDVAVVKASKEVVTVFVRVSGHKPAPFARTWNNPPGNGPFKQLLAKNIEVDWTVASKERQREERVLALAA